MLHVAGHGVVGGAANTVMGGKFGDGFISAAVSAAAGDAGLYGKPGVGGFGGVVARTVAAGIVGGTVSVLGGGKFANGAYTAAFQHLLNFELPKSALIAGLKWFQPGHKDSWLITEKDPMGQDLLRFPEVTESIGKLNASADPNEVIHWERDLGNLGPSPICTFVLSFFQDLQIPSLSLPTQSANLTRALVGSIHGGRVYRDSENFVHVSAEDTLSLSSASHLPPMGGKYGASILTNNMCGWNGTGGNVKLSFDVKIYMPKP